MQRPNAPPPDDWDELMASPSPSPAERTQETGHNAVIAEHMLNQEREAAGLVPFHAWTTRTGRTTKPPELCQAGSSKP